MKAFLKKLWLSSPESVTRGLRRRVRNLSTGEDWFTIQAGPAAGAQFLLPKPIEGAWVEFLDGSFDAFLYDALKHLNPKGCRCWDIGSHIGYHAFGLAGLGAEVVAFEPNVANAARFRQHLARNPEFAKRIRLVEKALSDHEGKVTFVQCTKIATGSSGSHLADGMPPLTYYPESEAVTVDAVRVDTLIERGEKSPDVIKIDVEGAELLVLQGARKLLAEKHPVILMEVHHICLMFHIQRLLLELGYSTTLLDEGHATASRCFVLATGDKGA